MRIADAPLALVIVAWTWELAVCPATAADRLDEAELRELHETLRPSTTEPWRTIPWKISLLAAQRAAASEKKPIFIWAMDGHPLGCT